MTLEEATKNATEWQEQHEALKTQLASLNSRDSAWYQMFRKMKEAQVMTEYYFGYDELIDPQNPKLGNRHRPGLVHKLMNEAQLIKEQSNLGERFSDRTFKNFDRSKDERAFQACINYVNRENLFKSKRNGLLILGSYGTGKTHLASAISNVFIGRGIPVLFGTFSTHLTNIRNEIDHTGERKELAQLQSIPILVLDDVGKEKKSEWTQQILYDIINYRYEHLLPVIITTNMTADDFANYVGGATYSRLYEMTEGILMRGKDYRLQ